jgi:hypothetical protein
MTDAWFVDELDADTVFRAALYKERGEVMIDGVHCDVDVICPDNVVAYLAVKSLIDAPLEVKAAGATLLSHAYRCALRHGDETVYRYAQKVFNGVEHIHFTHGHADKARELMARELRHCVACRVDVYTLFEKFVKCVEVSGDGYLFVLSRLGGVLYVYASNPADALDEINKRLLAHYRVVADADLETFETLTKIYAKVSC